nr:hypothetical protein [uncultured Lichenicoccus sp.]
MYDADHQTTISADPLPIADITGIASADLRSHEAQREHYRLVEIMQAQIASKPEGSYRTTIGEVAAAADLSLERVVAHLQDAWLVILDADPSKPMAVWTLEEDGE